MNTFTESCVMRVSVVLYYGGVFVVVGHYIPDLQIFHYLFFIALNTLQSTLE